MPQTLLPAATARRAAAAAERAAATVAANAAAAALAAADSTRTARADAFATIAADVAERRKALALDLTPAELAARVAALRARLVDLRHARRALLEADAARIRAADEREDAERRQGRALDGFAEAESALAAETAATARRQGWIARLAAPPLLTLRADAAAILAAAAPHDPFPAAKARVEGDIPTALRTRALERLAAEGAATRRAGAAAADADAALAPSRPYEAAHAAFERAETALGDHVLRAPDRLDTARGLLAGIAASPALTAADHAAIDDASLLAAREAAALLEKARDGKALTLAEKRAALRKKTLDLRAADVDADVAADADVQALQAEIATATTELAAAEAAYDAPARAALDAWEAAVPDASWASLLAFQNAKDLLTALAGLDPATLPTALATAEDALVTATAAADKRRRAATFLADAAALAERDRERATADADRRHESAVRGDQ